MGVKRLMKTFFRGIDRMVDDVLDSPPLDKDLMTTLRDITRDAGEALRPIMGTSEGWPWLAEYMVFHVFRRTIEGTIGRELEAKPHELRKRAKPPSLKRWKKWIFEDPEEEFTLGHSVRLEQLLNDSSDEFLKRTPDICLVHRNRIILAVEVKTTVAGPEILRKAFKKLTGIQERASRRPRSRAFFVSYGRTLEVKPGAVFDSYKDFYEIKGRYVGRFDHNLATNPLFAMLDSRGRRMKLLRLEECLKKVKLLLGYLTDV